MHALLLALLVSPPTLYKVATGPHPVVASHAKIAGGAGRERPIEMRVSFPRDAGKVPLIVFSHGFRGSMDNYRPLVDHWVSHGYAVIQPMHTDSARYLSREELRGAFDTNGGRSFANWAERPDDVDRILDSLDEIVRQVPALGSHLDRSRIGIGGHSFGAHTTQLLSGATPAIGRNFYEKRARAFVMISPQGVGGVFDRQSWSEVSSPCLFITGSKDTSITPTKPEQRRQPFDISKPGDKYLLWIEGATHGFGGISGARFPTGGPPNKAHLDYVRATTTAFWDAYLRADKRAAAFLYSKDLQTDCKNEATLSKK